MNGVQLPREVLSAWNTDGFAPALKRALEALPPGTLPLGRTGPGGGAVDDREVVVSVREWRRVGGEIRIGIRVFFHEVVAGCSCGDEPMPLHACAALAVTIDARSGVARFLPLATD